MIAVAWVLSLIAVGYLGYNYRRVNDLLDDVREAVLGILKKKMEEEAADNSVTFLDPDDIEFQTRVAIEEKRKELNRSVIVGGDDDTV